MPSCLDILYHDRHMVAINKPSGLLVHRSNIDRHETVFALQTLRNQLGQHVYPIHRLDKPTSGVLVFALSSDIARLLSESFASHKVNKTYIAVVRGWCPERGVIDHPLKERLDKMTDKRSKKNKPAQQAITHFNRLACTELAIEVDRYPQTRYSLVEARPLTGRKHQLRRHLKHIAHPIIGDAKFGKSTHNRFFQSHFNCNRLLLACTSLSLTHPVNQQALKIKAPIDGCFEAVIRQLGWSDHLPK